MIKKIILSLIIFLPFIQATNAQNINDGVRYSVLDIGGTARSVGIGGGIGALGADFSVLSTNPAGTAAFRRSEFTITPTYERSSMDARLVGTDNNTMSDSRGNFNFNNIGLVFSGRPMSSRWRTAVFGIGVNRMANYFQNTYYEGSSFGSITDRWWELAGTTPSDQLDAFEAGVAFDAGALYDYDPQLGYLTDFLDASELPGSFLVDKSQQINRKGSLNELVFSYAGNYDDKVYIGATLGVPILNFEETKIYRETDESDRVPFFDELEFTEKLTSKGSGINFKVGLIYRLSQMTRIGAAIHTPSSFGLEDSFSTELSYRYEDANGIQRFEAASPDGSFQYRLRTPWRFIGSGGVIINKMGFLSAELEFVDYSSAKFKFNNTTSQGDLVREEELNQEIKDQLGSALNIRFGGEYAIEMFRFRAGYSLIASPYSDDDSTNGAFSLGTGYRGEWFFVDVAYKRLSNQSEYRPYLLSTDFINLEQVVKNDEQRNRFMLTIGFKL